MSLEMYICITYKKFLGTVDLQVQQLFKSCYFYSFQNIIATNIYMLLMLLVHIISLYKNNFYSTSKNT